MCLEKKIPAETILLCFKEGALHIPDAEEINNNGGESKLPKIHYGIEKVPVDDEYRENLMSIVSGLKSGNLNRAKKILKNGVRIHPYIILLEDLKNADLGIKLKKINKDTLAAITFSGGLKLVNKSAGNGSEFSRKEYNTIKKHFEYARN